MFSEVVQYLSVSFVFISMFYEANNVFSIFILKSLNSANPMSVLS